MRSGNPEPVAAMLCAEAMAGPHVPARTMAMERARREQDIDAWLSTERTTRIPACGLAFPQEAPRGWSTWHARTWARGGADNLAAGTSSDRDIAKAPLPRNSRERAPLGPAGEKKNK